MEYLGWTLTDPAITKNPKDSRVYVINKKGERFTAVSIDAAMRKIIIRECQVSDCCGAPGQSTNGGKAFYDRNTGICGNCREHCSFVPEVDYYGHGQIESG